MKNNHLPPGEKSVFPVAGGTGHDGRRMGRIQWKREYGREEDILVGKNMR